ncbi:MAG: nuclear transport factor 2 family protein [Acidimicrobiia bacterium]|nr:nuclear transport factor 2 family protein [Acidimicrobiia bacterium]
MSDSARAIEHLLYTYAERIDAGDLDGVADLFAHGRIQAMPDESPEVVFEGRDAVQRLYDSTVRLYDDGTPMTKHITTNAIIEVDEGAGVASARSHYTVTQATDELPLQIIITGRYHDSFHRINGDWWFDNRIMIVDQTGDLSHHLTYEV